MYFRKTRNGYVYINKVQILFPENILKKFSYRFPFSCLIHGVAMYATYLGPIYAVILTNTILFGIIMYQLSTRPNSNVNASEVAAALTRLKRAIGIMLLLGISWVFGGALHVNSHRLVFSYLFAAFNSLQGIVKI